MSGDEELFTHTVTAWTVGQLRKALEGVPDNLPVRIIPAEEPGGDVAADDQVIIGAGAWVDVPGVTASDVRAALADGTIPPRVFEISTEFPSGKYYRRRT